MKHERIEIKLCTPADFLLGISRTTKGNLSEISFGLLLFSIVITFKR